MSLLASASDSVLKVWQLIDNDFRLKSTWEQPREKLLSVTWNHTNEVVAVGGTFGKIYLVHAAGGRLLSTLPFSETSVISGDIKSVDFSYNSHLLAAGAGRLIHVLDLKKRGTNAILQGHRGNLTCVRFHSEGLLFSGDDIGALKIWNRKENTSTIDLIPIDNRSAMTCLELCQNQSQKVACGYYDGSLCIWDSLTQELIRKQNIHNGILTAISVSPKNLRLVATGGHDGRVTLVDTASPRSEDPRANIDIGERISSLSFNEDSVHLSVGTTDGFVLLYDWRHFRKPVSKVPAHQPFQVQCLLFQVRVVIGIYIYVYICNYHLYYR